MIYLDYASATPLSKIAKEAMEPYLSEQFFNPSAPYLPAKRVRENYEDAKSKIAHTIGAKGNDLIITSGATEATNLAFSILGASVISSAKFVSVVEDKSEVQSESPSGDPARNASATLMNPAPRVLILETEHASVLKAAENYGCGKIKVKPSSGLIDLNDLKQKITPETMLISVAIANNELGTIQPMGEIAEIIQTEKRRRLENGETTPLYFHSDASQALGLLNVNIARLKTDLLTLNSAKVYGPKGVGALYVAHGVKLNPQILGGGQERNLRSGTENVPGVMGFAAATIAAKEHINSNRKKYESLKRIFVQTLENVFAESVPSYNHAGTSVKAALSHNHADTSAKAVPSQDFAPVFLGDKKHQLANFCPLSFPGLDAERLIYKLEDQEIYVSTGAACAASKGEKSHVLKAVGLSDAEIAGSIRVTFGAENDEEQIREAAEKIAIAAAEEVSRLESEDA